MAALVRVLADPAGEPDQRGVRAEGVTDSELRHRQVEHRVPVRAAQVDERDHQRQRDDGGGDDHRGPGPTGAPAAERLAHAHEVHEGATLTTTEQS